MFNYEVKDIEIAGKAYPYTIDEQKRWVVTGRYDKRECGGIDGCISNREILKAYLHKIMTKIQPEFILFEGVMYGCTFKFGKELDELCRLDGYEYQGILLSPDFNRVLENMRKRNGGKEINFLGLQDQWKSARKSTAKLGMAGVKVAVEDSSAYKLPELYRIVEKYI